MYYRLDGVAEDDPDLAPVEIRFVSDADVPWSVGVYHADPVAQPLRALVAPGSGSVMPDLIPCEPPLYSNELCAALREAGVDNLQLFDVEIRDMRHGKSHTRWKAVNIVGAVRCADLDASAYDESSQPPNMTFARLVVSEAAARGLPMFRLAEATELVLVSERVKRALDAAGLTGVRLVPLAPPGQPDSDDEP